jgi:transposase InsO family protein
MIYHRLGHIPQHIYKKVKYKVHKLINREVAKRKLLPPHTYYKHEHTRTPGKIWAEDFTEVRLYGRKVYIELVIDVAMPYYLGGAASIRPDNEMIETPIEQALELTGGKGPELFLLSDNAKQYTGSRHRGFLEKHEIVQKLIPSCKPQYNGAVECGNKEFKNVFYNVWAQREKRGMARGKPLLDRAELTVAETLRRMNEEIPRPALGGITAQDVWIGIAQDKREENRQYLEKELKEKEVIRPWHEDDWDVVRHFLFSEEFSRLELLTKFCFFLKKPLRQMTKLKPRVLGN